MKKILLTLLLFSSVLLFSQSPTCESASAICSGQGGPYNNTNNTTPGGNSSGYGTVNCLFSTPYPAWFYMQVGVSGSMDFTLVQTVSSGNPDVDFALWGPFTSLNNYCDNLYGYSAGYTGPNNVVDCSYSGSATETINIPGATAGQYYILLVTNYGQQPGSYTINQTGGTGSLSCEIVCGVDLGPDQQFCNSTITSYTMTAEFNQAPTTVGTPTYSWYLGGVLQGTTTTNQYTANQEGTWTVEVIRPGCSDVATDDIEILFDSEPILNSPPPISGCAPFDLTSIIPGLLSPANPADYVVYFYEDINDAFTGSSNYIATPTSYTPGFTDIFIRVENNGNPTCYNVDEILQLIIDCASPCSLTLTSAVSSDAQTICLTDALDDIIFTAGGDATDVVVTSGSFPTGVTGVYNAGTYTVSGTPTQTGSFAVTISTVGCATNITHDITIVVNEPSDAGLDGNTTVCDNDTNVIDLYALISGEQTGGVWTQTSGVGGTFDATAGTYTPALGATTSTFEYTITGAAPCPDDVSVATITIVPQANAGTDGATTTCESSSTAIDLFSLLTGAQTGGTWTQTSGTGGTFNAGAGTYTPALGATTSTFEYTITGTPPCVDDVSVVTVTITATPDAGNDNSITLCSTSSSVDLFTVLLGSPDLGGTWSPALASGTGVFDPAVDTAGVYTYTIDIPGCTIASAAITVTINAQPDAGLDGATTVCDSDTTAIDLFALLTGAQTGGVWTQTSGTGGVFNAAAGTYTPASGATTSTFEYTLTGVAPCVDDMSVVTVNINAQPDAGLDGGVTICDNDTNVIDLFSLITGEQTGGVWTQTSGTGGTFDAAAGTYTPASGATTSTFEYTLTGVAPCIDDVSVATITINAQPDAGLDGNTTICDNDTAAVDLFALLTGAQTGGVWTQTSGTGGVFNAAAGTYTPAPGATTSTFEYTLTGVAPCVDDMSVVTVNINAQPDAGLDGGVTICDNDTNVIDLFSLITGEQSGGVWTQTSGTGGVFNAVAGTYTPAPGATTSTFEYTLTGVAPCVDDVSVATITINAQPDAGLDGSTSVCDSDTTTIDLFALLTGAQTGGVWTQTSGTGGVFDAAAGTYTPASGATTSTFEYTLTGVAPCVDDTSIVTVTITAQPDAGLDGNTTVCDNDTTTVDLFTLLTGAQTGGVWTQTSGTGGVFNAAAGTYTPASGATTSTFEYTLTGVAPCIDDTSVVTININAQPDAGLDGATTVCDNDTNVIDLFSLITGEQSGGVWTQTSGTGGVFDAVAGTYTPAPGATSSTFEYTLTGVAPCIDDVSVATITINAQPDAGLDGNTTVCDNDTTTINLFALLTGAQTGGVWTQTSGTGGVFDAAAGTYTPASGATTSTFEYTLTGVAPCIDDTSVVTININAQPDAGLDGAITVCESDTAVIDLYALISGEQAGGVWTQTSGTGGVFDAVAGTYTPAPGATTSTFEYTLTGVAPCIDDTSVVTITVNPDAEITLMTDITTTDQELCQGTAISTIEYELSNGATGVIVAGLPAGITYTINGNIVTISGTPTDLVGVYNYSVTTTGGCSSDMESGSIEITNGVLPTFDPMPDICEGSGYSLPTTSTNGITGSWSPAFDNTQTMMYTFTPDAGQCAIPTTATVTIIEKPVLSINNPLPITLCDGEFLHVDWTSNVAGTTLTYTASSNNVTYPSNGDQSTLDQVLSLINSDQIGDITITITPFANGCSGDAIQVPVRINPNPVISSVSVDQNTICSGNEVTFTVTSNLGGTTYDWSVINNTGVTVVGGVTSGTITTGTLMLVLENSTPGLSGTIEVDFTPYRDGCPGATVVSEVITVNPIPGVPNGLPEYYICDGEATPMSITSDPFVAGTELIYDVVDYYNVTGYSSGGPLPEPLLIEDVLTLTDSYVQGYVVYRIWATLNGCDGEYRDFTVYVNPNPQPVLTDGAICVNDIGTVFQTYWLTVEGLPGTNYQYTWYESSDPVNPIAITGVPSLEVAVAGSYYVVVRDLSSTDTSCEGTSNTVSVIETNPATSFITTVTDAFSDNATVVVTVTGGNGMLLYQIDGGAFQESNVFTGVSAGEHVITVIDSQGCTYLQETVLVIDYPNFFTPNGDGYNDTWNIIGLNQPEAKLYIFDRYGKLIKQLSTVGPGWDGTYNGEQLPSTDYWFSLEYLENGVAKEFKAHFAMKR
ncbi:T9SS type B sorting domain-containing protein [Flavobacterium okayamense]|uniref:Gliding motility-associated C-terminal domain-containing protein n=1 Tax=Flavobacterium okayamense TaxID=2830782 RepID=A0ABM7S7X0_9FLAO|nr:T9SS type B sorting domain-containing protein [Flavobacterium okayamense]BCY28737.1 hypothetical protein KK2020170_16050 [Flavobacterium okayamense]